MGRLSKRRGAVSVFLLLIFMVTYVFMGLLVDAGRYRMAQTYVENALDNASNSLLSNYNQLVFDLYGLFAVDMDTANQEELEKQIEETYEKYLDEALGIVQIDSSDYTTELANLIFADNNVTVLDVSSLYDFQKSELNAGTGITLADTANVESQIIEYMKFRAPVQLAGDMDGFLKKMNEILTIKDSLAIAIEKNEIVDKYENPATGEPLSEEAHTLLKDINTFAKKLYNYSVDPTKELPVAGSVIMKSSEENPYKLLNVATIFDAALKKACDNYEITRNTAENSYCTQMYDKMADLKAAMEKEKAPEIKLSREYILDDKENTKNFTEVNLMRISHTELMEIADEVISEASTRTNGNDFYGTFVKNCETEKTAYEAKLDGAVNQYEKDISKARENLVDSVIMIEENANTLNGEIKTLRDRIEVTFTRYESYVSELESKVESHKNDDKYQQYLTQYGPTIELAKANGGELIKNLDILLNSRENLDNIYSGYTPENGVGEQKLSDWVGAEADIVISGIKDYECGTELLASMISNYKYTNGAQSKDLYCNPYKEAVGELFPNMQGDISTLWSRTSYFYNGNYRSDVDVEVSEDITENNVSKSGKEDLSELKGLSAVDNELIRQNPNWLNVSYSYTPTADDGFNGGTKVELQTGKVEKGFMSQVLELGSNLLDGLGKLLKGARDNLYVDAYVMSSFSNYKEWKAWEENGKKTSDLKYLNAPYEKDGVSYNASYAEVEYIITGKGATLNDNGTASEGFGENSVESIRIKLFGTRMLFNTLSILLDNGKVLQAQSLSAWAGLLAPLVTVVLLAAWAAMESVIDVMVLMGDVLDACQTEQIKYDMKEGVLIYKGGRDWYFSASGVAEFVTGVALDTLANKITDEATELISSLETKTNAMIYDAYTSTQSTVDGIFEEINLDEAQEVVAWGEELTKNVKTLPGVDSDSMKTLETQLDGVANAFKQVDEMKEQVDTGLLTAKEQATIAVSRMSKEASDSVKKGVDSMKKSAKDVITQNIDKVIPVGKVVNTGTNAGKVRMTYKEYLYFYLFTMNQTEKIQRIQSVIQANMRVGGQENFSMERSPVSVWADLECSMRYMFLSNGIVPESMKKDGRLRFKVISAQSY